MPLAELSAETHDKLKDALPPYWSHASPVDILGDAPPEQLDADVAGGHALQLGAGDELSADVAGSVEELGVTHRRVVEVECPAVERGGLCSVHAGELDGVPVGLARGGSCRSSSW